jgi:hypothetical protein
MLHHQTASRQVRTCCTRAKCFLFAAATIASTASVAQAILNIDLRATSVNGQPLQGSQTAKSIPQVQVGDVITFDVLAIIVGTNASLTDDRIISAAGSFLSTPPGFTTNMLGNLLGDVVPTIDHGGDTIVLGFDAFGASAGLQQDLDGDGDLDVGSNDHSNTSDFWRGRFQVSNGISAGSLNPLTGGRRMGFGTFTITGGVAPDVSVTDITFIPRQSPTSARWHEDGVFKEGQSVSIGSPIRIGTFVPEPINVALIALVGLGFRRRRRGLKE